MLQHSIDHTCVRDGQIFSYGWGFFAGKNITKLDFHYKDSTGSMTKVSVDYGRQRDDVKSYFKDIPEAENAGFLLLAGSIAYEIDYGYLRWHLDDEQHIDTPLNFNVIDKVHTLPKLETINIFFLKILFLFRNAGLKALYQKVKRYLSGRPHSLSDSEWSEIRNELHDKELHLIVDHDMGGGANIFRNDLISEKCANKKIVVLLSFHISSLQYFIQIFSEEKSNRYSIKTPETIISILSSANLKEIFYNCAVTFKNPLSIVYVLLNLKKTYNAKLTIAVHDYFLVCPSHFLLDSNSRFCNVPDRTQCNSCLSKHTDGFVSLTGIKDISLWRNKWHNLLDAADEVRLFSNSSHKLLSKAYPKAANHNWRIIPHQLKSEIPLIDLNSSENLHIGVIGAIGKHKGSQIISSLAQEILDRKLDVKITVIGTIEAKTSSQVVTVTGAYQAVDLGELIKNSGANVFLFPSICPETFSFVSHEIVQMGLPYACFDLGAPADLARSYANGKVLSSFEPEEILNSLEELKTKFYKLRDREKK